LESKSLTDVPAEITQQPAKVHRSRSIQAISRKESNTNSSDTEQQSVKLQSIFKKDPKKIQKLEPILDMTPIKSQAETFLRPSSDTITSNDQRAETCVSASNCDTKLANAVSTISVLNYDRSEQFTPMLEKDNAPPLDLPPVPPELHSVSSPLENHPPIPKRAPPPLPIVSMSVSLGPSSSYQSSINNSEVYPPFYDDPEKVETSFIIKRPEPHYPRRTLTSLSGNSTSGYDHSGTLAKEKKIILASERTKRKLVNSRSLGHLSDKENSEPKTREQKTDEENSEPKTREKSARDSMNPSEDLDAYLQSLALQQFSAFGVKPW